MNYKILLTSTSFQDTPGAHQKLLEEQNFEIKRLRGPLKEIELIGIIDKFDGIICGDDEITKDVIIKGACGKLKVISKYGIGLDKIDLSTAKKKNVIICNCPGVNKETVAEHVFALLLTYIKNIIQSNEIIQNQAWHRYIGNDLHNKTIGVLGTGNIGKQVIIRALAFVIKVIDFYKFQDIEFKKKYNIKYLNSQKELFQKSDIISLNMSLDSNTRNIINTESINLMKRGVIIINTARAGLVNNNDILKGIEKKIIEGYLTDVLEEEPMIPNHPFILNRKILITPHIGSRTYENIEKQGTMAVKNLLMNLKKNE